VQITNASAKVVIALFSHILFGVMQNKNFACHAARGDGSVKILIVVLVVIALIGTLVGLLIPAT
jgi:hypothetical protein